ncbi:MAG: hypothetical protein LBU88_03160 [Treponema sp.]|jgi:hypothetical protein|nr:hypothetical protein [Treponema sp.]
MELNFGEQVDVKKSKNGFALFVKVLSILAFPAFLVLAFVVMFGEEFQSMIGGLGIILFSIIIIIVNFYFANKLYQVVTIFTEGVIIKGKKYELKFRYDEIIGLRDVGADSGMTIVTAGGIVGGIVAGLAGAVGGNISDKHRRKNRLREVVIVPNEGKEIKVTKTAGDIVSEFYTAWLISTKGISDENVGSLSMPFGENLEYNSGILTQKHKNKDRSIVIKDATWITVRNDSKLFQAWGLNEIGKETRIIEVKLKEIYNLDLLFYIADSLQMQDA